MTRNTGMSARGSRRPIRSRRAGWRVPAVVGLVVAILGGIMFVSLPNASAAPAPIRLTSKSCPSVIKQGQHSGCVVELQKLLNRSGAKLAVDGSFGPATYKAVRSYQSHVRITVDGLVGPQT